MYLTLSSKASKDGCELMYVLCSKARVVAVYLIIVYSYLQGKKNGYRRLPDFPVGSMIQNFGRNLSKSISNSKFRRFHSEFKLHSMKSNWDISGMSGYRPSLSTYRPTHLTELSHL